MWEEVLAPRRTAHEPRDFRNALGCFPTGVALVTTLAPDGRRTGLTANSFSSVSLDPPMVLWSLARSASSAPVFRDAEYFAINVLASSDAALSSHFAKPGRDKFLEYSDRFREGIAGVPLLEGAVATFECHSRHRYYGGDHIIVIGVVERYAHRDGAPLAFHRGRYASVKA
ncbi:MAG TPA: flavin reductase family protein [Burkholderiales bacterium]|jgi:flavin reductase (DIM6/NTAB) family NADH-FMN oxidoreductase RutF|nr:flavin reductase family protein [Burkholderiales bacterium]